MKHKHRWHGGTGVWILAALLPLAALGCGGSGGGGIPGGTLYTGGTTEASLDGTNAEALAGTALFGTDTASDGVGAAFKAGGGHGVVDTIMGIANTTIAGVRGKASQSSHATFMWDCYDPLSAVDGSITFDASGISAGGTGTVSITFTACNLGDDT